MSYVSKFNVLGKSVDVKDNEARKLITEIENKTKFYTPEEYGAVGDGITDDTAAMSLMFTDAINAAELISLENSKPDDLIKDFRNIRFVFSGKYGVSENIVLPASYGLNIKKLNLTALSGFTGESLITLSDNTRQCVISDCILDGKWNVPTLITIPGYTLNLNITNSQLTRFKQYGCRCFGKGHEIMFSGCKINQYDYYDWNNEAVIKEPFGVGILFETNRHDNHVTDCIFSYTVTHGFIVKGGTCNIIGCHFYGANLRIEGAYNSLIGNYFDGGNLDLGGLANTVSDCLFNIDDVSPAINLIESDSTKWKYETTKIIGCVFSCFKNHNNYPVKFGGDYNFNNLKIHVNENTFNKVKSFNAVVSPFVTPMNYEFATKYTGNGESGNIIFNDIMCQWGTITGSGPVTFAKEFDGYVPVVMINNETAVEGSPGASNVTVKGFNANNVMGKSRWLAIGRVVYQ